MFEACGGARVGEEERERASIGPFPSNTHNVCDWARLSQEPAVSPRIIQQGPSIRAAPAC